MPPIDNIEFIRSRLVSYPGPTSEEREALPTNLRGRLPDREWACAMFELLGEIDRLRQAESAAPKVGKITIPVAARFKANLSTEEFASFLTAALNGDVAPLVAAFDVEFLN